MTKIRTAPGHSDHTPLYTIKPADEYEHRCPECYLGYPHTVALHKTRLVATGPLGSADNPFVEH